MGRLLTVMPAALVAICTLPPHAHATTTFPPQAVFEQAFRLHHVTLFANDHEALCAWYVKHLGFEIVDRSTLVRSDGLNIPSIRVGFGGLWINISKVANLAERDPGAIYGGWRQLAIAVPDVQSTWERLRESGVKVIGNGTFDFEMRRTEGASTRFRAAFIRDPEGNVIELYQDL